MRRRASRRGLWPRCSSRLWRGPGRGRSAARPPAVHLRPGAPVCRRRAPRHRHRRAARRGGACAGRRHGDVRAAPFRARGARSRSRLPTVSRSRSRTSARSRSPRERRSPRASRSARRPERRPRGRRPVPPSRHPGRRRGAGIPRPARLPARTRGAACHPSRLPRAGRRPRPLPAAGACGGSRAPVRRLPQLPPARVPSPAAPAPASPRRRPRPTPADAGGVAGRRPAVCVPRAAGSRLVVPAPTGRPSLARRPRDAARRVPQPRVVADGASGGARSAAAHAAARLAAPRPRPHAVRCRRRARATAAAAPRAIRPCAAAGRPRATSRRYAPERRHPVAGIAPRVAPVRTALVAARRRCAARLRRARRCAEARSYHWPSWRRAEGRSWWRRPGRMRRATGTWGTWRRTCRSTCSRAITG